MNDNDLGTMNLFEAEAHSFIVRLWREDSNNSDGSSSWRGRVEHVQSGRYQYFSKLEDVAQILYQQTGEVVDLDDVFEPDRPNRSES